MGKLISKINEFFTLLILKVVVTTRNIQEYFLVILRYYPHPLFRRVDFYLIRNYILQNPYKMAKKHFIKMGQKDIYSYGETPLTTLEMIAVECGIKAQDHVYELGSGRGRSCFWLRCFKGCSVTGIEYIPEFVHIAQKTQRLYGVKGVKFLYQDILDTDLSEATMIYYYGTCAEAAFIMKLIEKFKSLKPGVMIITVSYPLTSYTPEPLFKVVKTFPAWFTWGMADVYLHIKL